MGLSYDPGSRKWNLVYEKNDYKTDYPTNLPTDLQTNYPEVYFYSVPVQKSRSVLKYKTEPYTVYVGDKATTQYRTVSVWEKEYYTEDERRSAPDTSNIELNKQNKTANENNALTNKGNAELNETNAKTNTDNTNKNTAYDKTLAVANNTRGGDYVSQREVIRTLSNVDQETKETLENYFKSFYSLEKLQPWDSNLGAKPPYGDFDASYYKEQNPAASQQWNAAVANDDIDITQRYGENGYYLHHYTSTGKPAGARGNREEALAAAEEYVEKTPTDQELEQVRNLQLGVNTNTQTERLLGVPEVALEWEKAKQNDSYWKSLARKYFLDVKKPDEFAALYRLSNRPEDKEVAFNYNLNTGYGITDLEDALNQAVGEKATVDVKKFGALAQDVLKQTIGEMKKAKAREQEISMFSGFGALKEIVDINKELTTSILGDSGVGGVLSFMGGSKGEESLEKALKNITGVNNNVMYNWQQWFDDTLKKKYQSDLELGLSVEQAEQNVQIQGEFARQFIDKYLIPRFNESRSMDEFVEYLDVRQSEQNPFQTQDMLNAAKLVADIRSKQYIDQLKQTPERYFNSEFYFNPTGNKARVADYADQAATVAADWEAAKKGDPYWKQQAYRFGVDVNNKDAFAKMHFQVKGQSKGYDSADDILNAGKVSDYIYGQILPALKEEALKQGTVFGQFLLPKEFADEMLKGLDPNDKDTWNEVLKRYGLTDFKGTIEELKEYIIDSLRTGTAQEIREQIKYLNEKKEKPTQETLGVTYIQREEDYKPEAQIKGNTELYKVFQSAGFQGTEDEFYENFFPDLNRSEQVALTKAGKDEALKTTGLDFSDPFASLGTVESFFGETDDETQNTDIPKKSSYFTIDEDEDLPSKTKSGQGFLDEFTSLFKGLS